MTPRSAKAIAQSKLKQMIVDDDTESFEGVNDDEEDSGGVSSSDESEYGAAKKRTVGAPPAKRAKISGPGAASSTKQKSPVKQTARGKKSLSLLPTMPLDILFEIIGFLNPKDIICVSRTNKLFRETLRFHGATTVWKRARERLGAPQPPSDMSEVAWAALLFGNVCQSCGAKNIQNVDFLLRRRLCTNCKKRHLVVESRLKTRFPDVDKSLLDLISHTNVGGWAHGRASSSRFFWANDIEKMARQLAVYEHDVHLHRANARTRLDDFKAQQIKRVEDIHTNARHYQRCLDSLALQREKDNDNLQDLRRNAIYERFIELGYVKEDILHYSSDPEFNKSTQLTDRIWQRIRPKFEPKILERKAERLARDLALLKRSRRQIVDGLYKTYKASVHPSQWIYLPRTFDICELEPFARFIDSPADVTVAAENFDQAMQELPVLLSTASDERKTQLRCLLPTDITALPGASIEPGEILTSPSSSGIKDGLELAVSVFQCPKRCYPGHDISLVLVGLEDLMTHDCDDQNQGLPKQPYSYFDSIKESPSTRSDFSFNERGSAIARSLICLAGLDPKTALVSDMDRKDLRFACIHCIPQKQHTGSWIRFGYSWRTAISHALSNSHPKGSSSLDLTWSILSAEEANSMKANEQADGKWKHQLWTCGHCSQYMTHLQTRSTILQHLLTAHQISVPKEPDDLFFFERFRSPFHKKITFLVSRPATALKPNLPSGPSLTMNMRCVHCASGKASERQRLFNAQGVVQHIKDKHRITNPQNGTDWTQAIP